MLVGVGQVTSRPRPGDASTWVEPLTLMTDAVVRASEDAAVREGGRTPLLERIDELIAIPSFVWHVPDPARRLADELSLTPRSTVLAFVGGTSPERAVLDASKRIQAGELDVAVVVGAEAMKSRDLARKAGVVVAWATQDEGVAPAPTRFEVPDALTDHERSLGLGLPVHTYALFEHALRRARGWSRAEHAAHLGALAGRMSAAAARHEVAWLHDPSLGARAATVAEDNRLVSAPYTKLLASNVMVDMGAAVIVSSAEAARAAGVPDDRWVFPHHGAYAREQWLISERDELHRSVAMRACAGALFGGGAPDDEALAHLELYSCFPVVVQMACEALGIDPLHDPRPPSVTGGMTFFGGPGNNFTTHSIATMADTLRDAPGSVGLVTGLGWYASTHVWATYSTSPPATPFHVEDVQDAVSSVALRAHDDAYEGRGEVEGYTVGIGRDGAAARAIASVRTPSGARCLVATEDPAAAAEVLAADPLGAQVAVGPGSIKLR